jgi:VanZ family protein
MLPLRFAYWWLGAGLLALAVGLAVALTPQGPVVLPVNLNDKLAHAGAFLVFMVWFLGLVEFRRAWRVALALVLYGILIELLQSLTSTRQAEFGDVLADGAGVLLGWVLGAAGLRHWCSRVESWLVPPQRNPGQDPPARR